MSSTSKYLKLSQFKYYFLEPNGYLRCSHDNITNLRINYVNRPCFDTITHVEIKSGHLTVIDDHMLFSANYTGWNIIYLYLILDKDIDNIRVTCDAFRHLKKLRNLRMNKAHIQNFECIFQNNADLVKIEWNTTRVWNMCNGSFDFWINDKKYDESNFTKTIMEMEHRDESDNIVIQKRISRQLGNELNTGTHSDYISLYVVLMTTFCLIAIIIFIRKYVI